jgi:hypothetical protein
MSDQDQTTETRDPEDVASDAPDADAGGKAHTKPGEPHPAGDGERSDRDVGGPAPERP